MAWQDELTTITRRLLADTSATPKYSDDDLEETLVIAAQWVLTELRFPAGFRTSVSNLTITPDPTDDAGNTRDNNFVNLVCLKAACILDRGGAATAAAQAILVQDGTSRVDLRDAFKAQLQLIRQGWCAVYDAVKEDYQAGQRGGVLGAAILGPFRVFGGYAAGPGGGALYQPRRF